MTPPGLDLLEELDARTVRLAPYPAVPGVGWVLAATAFVAAMAILIWQSAALVVALAVFAIAAPPLLGQLHDARRSTFRLDVRIGRDDLRLRWRADEPGDERVFLRDVAKVVPIEVSPGRWHVVVHAGPRELRIPMERDPHAAARWLADTIGAAARAARERDGGGRAEVPAQLRRLRQSEQ